MEKIQNADIKAQLKKNMAEQITKFGWRKCAEETLELFGKTVKK